MFSFLKPEFVIFRLQAPGNPSLPWAHDAWPELGTWGIFNFSIIKNNFFAFFIKLITYSKPVLFKKPTPSQINLIKNAKKKKFFIEKIKKYRKCPALRMTHWQWPPPPPWSLTASLSSFPRGNYLISPSLPHGARLSFQWCLRETTF